MSSYSHNRREDRYDYNGRYRGKSKRYKDEYDSGSKSGDEYAEQHGRGKRSYSQWRDESRDNRNRDWDRDKEKERERERERDRKRKHNDSYRERERERVFSNNYKSISPRHRERDKGKGSWRFSNSNSNSNNHSHSDYDTNYKHSNYRRDALAFGDSYHEENGHNSTSPRDTQPHRRTNAWRFSNNNNNNTHSEYGTKDRKRDRNTNNNNNNNNNNSTNNNMHSDSTNYIHLNYKQWSPNDVFDWIISIDNRFKSYNKLKTLLNDQEINGGDLEQFTEENVKCDLGINIFSDKKLLFNKIKELINDSNTSNAHNNNNGILHAQGVISDLGLPIPSNAHINHGHINNGTNNGHMGGDGHINNGHMGDHGHIGDVNHYSSVARAISGKSQNELNYIKLKIFWEFVQQIATRIEMYNVIFLRSIYEMINKLLKKNTNGQLKAIHKYSTHYQTSMNDYYDIFHEPLDIKRGLICLGDINHDYMMRNVMDMYCIFFNCKCDTKKDIIICVLKYIRLNELINGRIKTQFFDALRKLYNDSVLKSNLELVSIGIDKVLKCLGFQLAPINLRQQYLDFVNLFPNN